MLTAIHFQNPETERSYLLEYGLDLFGNHFVKVRYGIKLGITKTYLFSGTGDQLAKVDEIIAKRKQHGYRALC